ncbi:MAG: hypothetical protein ACRD3M_10900 [Thermoanaerobaculia bacterium]
MRCVSPRAALALSSLILTAAALPGEQGGADPASTPAPGPCSAPENRQFDFWVGDWNVLDPQGQQVGTNDIQSILGGCVVYENWSGGGLSGKSFNIWDAAAKKWRQSWVDDRGRVLLLEGEFKDGKMVLEGRRPAPQGGTALDRITWNRIGDSNRVRQLWEASRDGGRSWKVLFDGTYVHKR